MTAYAVFIREETLDQSELATYTAKLKESWSSFEACSLELLAANGNQEVIEGSEVEGVVLLKFPSVELARQWYHSPSYQALVEHRLKGGKFRSIIFAGIDSDSSGK
ncbi:DUF1330 domain-containing protein [Halomonas sp. ATBC28]|nr:DUF1330 domain-containing protein [Halomonas sp. ATBC28]